MKYAGIASCLFLLSAPTGSALTAGSLVMSKPNPMYQAFLDECEKSFVDIVGDAIVLSRKAEDEGLAGGFRSTYFYKMKHENNEVSGPYSFECRQKPGEEMSIWSKT